MRRSSLPLPGLLPLAACLLLLARTPPSRAGDGGEVAPTSLGAEDVGLLPVSQVEWLRVARDHPDLVERIRMLAQRASKIRDHLAGRKDPQDAGGRTLAAELGHTDEQMRPLLDQLVGILAPMGLTPEVLAVMRHAPRGPLREERQAVRVVLDVPGLSEPIRRLHRRLVPAVDAALLTLALEAQALERPRDGAEAARARLRTRIEALQKRFWRVVDATLDEEQRIALRRRLPTKMTKLGGGLGHLFLLPGLSVSQSTRLKSMLVRIDAEAAPDKALLARIHERLGEKDVGGGERLDLARQQKEAQGRQADLMLSAWKEGHEILDAAQWDALRSVPPCLTAQERSGDLKQVLSAIRLEPGQRTLLEDLKRRYGPVRGEMLQRLGVLALQEKEMGPDAPEKEGMEAMRRQVYAEGLQKGREAAADLFRSVLEPEQVFDWVLGLSR